MARQEDSIVRAARVRALVTAFVNRALSYVTIKMVDDALKDNWMDLGYENSPVESAMHLLSGNGTFRKLGRLNTAKGEAVFIANDRDISGIPELQHLRPAKTVKSQSTKFIKIEGPGVVDQRPMVKPPKPDYQPGHRPEADLTVDVLKDTGRVRLTIGGMVIDIGVK